MKRVLWCGLLCVAAASMGCATGGHVAADGLAVKRVVVYRNGVGYFERVGKVGTNRVTFKVRPSHVDDFLASLAVTGGNQTTVKSASFTQVKKGKDKSVKVTLDLAGDDHDLRVRYVAATPVWKPTYRVIVEDGKLQLQAWAIVHNLSGEDWQNVKLSLVAGAPISFEATLGTPITPKRPVITDRGEVVSHVPVAHTRLALKPAAAPRPKAAVAYKGKRRWKKRGKVHAIGGLLKELDTRGIGFGGRGIGGGGGGAGFGRIDSGSRRSVLGRAATVAVRGGLTRYDVPNPVTLPNKSATMVVLISKEVPGSLMYLFDPTGGVRGSSTHPFRVVRFKNDTEGLFERGPVTMIESGTFLGQGVAEPIPAGATTTIPFALERGLAVGSRSKTTHEGARVAKISAGKLWVEQDSVYRTTYTVRNGMAKDARIMIKHRLRYDTKLHNQPKGTEHKVGKRQALIPADAAARAVSKQVVEERRNYRRHIDWFSGLAPKAVKAFLADAKVPAPLKASVKAAWTMREQLRVGWGQKHKLNAEKRTLQRASRETRANITAIAKNKKAAKLKKTLTARLAKYTARLDKLVKEQVALDDKLNTMRVRFIEATRGINYVRK